MAEKQVEQDLIEQEVEVQVPNATDPSCFLPIANIDEIVSVSIVESLYPFVTVISCKF